MIKKTLLSLSIASATLLGTAQMAHAQTNNNFFQNIVQAIAQKFNLNQSDVQSVVNQTKTQNQAQRLQNMQNRENTRLDNLVKKGTITSAQEQQIKDEIAKLQSEYPMGSFRSETSTQRKQTMQNMQNEINAWSTSTGIDKKYLMPFGVIGMGARRAGWFGKGKP